MEQKMESPFISGNVVTKVKGDRARVDVPAPDTIVVPGVAFDRRGHRLGYGRGYYDRALSARPEALRIGFCHSFQLVEKLDERPHDEPVDFIVTPDGAQATHARASKETP